MNGMFTCNVTDIQSKAVSYLRRLFVDLSLQRWGFNPK